jgi:hypothetical protein
MFFEREIFGSLFEQTLRESQLAKFASRLVSMDQAGERIKEKLAETIVSKQQVIHRIQNKKQLDGLIGTIWQTQ